MLQKIKEILETIAVSRISMVAAVRNIFYPKFYSDIGCKLTSVNERI